MTSTLTTELEQIARAETVRGGFNGTVDVKEAKLQPCFHAGIDSQTLSRIYLHFNPEYEKENPGKIARVVSDLIKHEVNHRQYKGFHGCPRTVENHAELLFEPMAKVLTAKKYSLDDVHYVVNCLEDTLLQEDFGSDFTLDGVVDFFADVAEHNGKKFTEFYEANVKLNLFLWGNKKQKKQLQKYFKHTKKIQEVLHNFLEKTGISQMGSETYAGAKKLKIKDREQIRAYLTDEKNWPEISRIYAEEFSKLMQPGYALPLSDHSGSGTKGNPKPSQGKDPPGQDEDQSDPGKKNNQPQPSSGNRPKAPPRSSRPQEGNPFDQEMYFPGFKKKRVQRAYSRDESVPKWMTSFEALDLLYQSLAQKLVIKVEAYTHQTSKPIFHYGRRPFDPDRDNFRHLAVGFDEKGKVQLQKRKYHEDMPLEYKVDPKGFPEIRFCLLDTSGSQTHAPSCHGYCMGDCKGKDKLIPWGDQSKYHYCLLAWYGLLEYLKSNHLLSHTNVCLGNFSDRTYLAKGLDEAKKVALSPQFGNTILNLKKVESMFLNQGMLVFTLSDGEISNWYEIKEQFIKLAKQHHYFHLQFGPDTQMTQDLREAGLKVESIMNGLDLANKVIDLTDRLYRSS